MDLKRIRVLSSAGPYPVLCGTGLVGPGRLKTRLKVEIAALASQLQASNIFLVSSQRVARHWRAQIEPQLKSAGWCVTILMDDREAAKNLATVERLCRALVRAGADRRSLLVAMGGGVVGDVCGFVAASFLRGVALVHVPTTLVAQVDSAIGGKTGVNLPEGKNLVGAFYSPRLVLADPRMLETLPNREFRSGLYEVVKYGVIAPAPAFSLLEKNIDRLIARDATALGSVIPLCIRAKATVVGRDERESGLREILNFGHTFAHALETATRYRRYLHGEAVGWGMIAASRLAAGLGLFAPADAARVEDLVRRIGPLPPLPNSSSEHLVHIMRADKKTRGGTLRFVLPRRIGRVETTSAVPPSAVLDILNELHTAAPMRRKG